MSRNYLLNRQGWYYFRIRIPLDLQPYFDGRRELTKSLRTTLYNDAQSSLRSNLYKTERLFAKIRGGMMTIQEARKLVVAYFEDTMALAEDARADGTGVLGEDNEDDGSNDGLEGLDLHLSDLVEDLARGKSSKEVVSVADSILACAGLTMDKGSHEYRMLCRETLKGVIAATKVQLARMRGDYAADESSTAPAVTPGSTSAPAKVKPAEVEPVRLSVALAEFVKEHDASGRWRPKTREETEGVFRLLVGIVGDRDMSELDYKVLSNFRGALLRFPSNHTKRPAYRGKSISEIVSMTRNVKAASPLSPSSVNKHIVRTGAFLKWAMKRGYVAANFAEGLTVVRKVKESEEREAYSTEDLLRLVQSPLAGFRDKRPERFWIPLLGLFTGARLNELCQLHLEDIGVENEILCIDINSRGEKTLKNAASKRVVPVHPILLGLGFKEYVGGLRKKGEKRLWPALGSKRGGYGDDFSKWYGRWNRKHVTTSKKKVFHSLRANFVTTLLNAGVDAAVVSALVGHVGGSMTLDRYHKGFSVTMLRDAVGKLSYGREVEEEILK